MAPDPPTRLWHATMCYRLLPIALMALGAAMWRAKAPVLRPLREVLEEHHYRDYRLRIYGDWTTVTRGEPGWVRRLCEVRKGGRLVFSREAVDIWTPGHRTEPLPREAPVPMGTDVDGDRGPDLGLVESDGSVLGLTAAILRLGPTVVETAKFPGQGEAVRFHDMDGDARREVLFSDRIQFPGATGPWAFAAVVLRCEAGKWMPAVDLMRCPLPSQDWMQGAADVHRSEPGDYLGASVALWDDVLWLLYAGHEAAAYRLVERCWHPGWPDRKAEMRRFREALEESWWPEIAAQYRAHERKR